MDPMVVQVLVFSGSLALMAVVGSGIWLWSNKTVTFPYTERMGKAGWTFTSWASVVGFAGTLLSILFSLQSSTPPMYKNLSAVLTLSLILAPGVYWLIGSTVAITSKTGEIAHQRQGFVIGFFMACLFTLFGAIGQVVSAYYWLQILSTGGYLVVLVLLVTIVGILLVYQSINTMYWTVRDQVSVPAVDRSKTMYHAEMLRINPSLSLTRDEVNPPKDSVSLL